MRKQLVIMFVLLTFLSACVSAPSSSGIEVSNPTIVLPGGDAMGMDMGQDLSGYMKIKNTSGSNDRLIGVTCDFASAMLHETTINGDVASMAELSSIDIPAGGIVEFKHGGLHIMFMNPAKDLKVGDQVDLTLEFEKAGKVTVAATVTEP
jgi:periplasmic copper chaperone A